MPGRSSARDLADGTGAPLRRGERPLRRRSHRRRRRREAAAPATPWSTPTGWSSRPASSTSTTIRASGLATDPAAATQVAQGITTVVVGPDGGSPWPIGDYLAERRQHAGGGQRRRDGRPRDRAAAGDEGRLQARRRAPTKSRGWRCSSIRGCAKARSACRAASSTRSAATPRRASWSSSRRSPRATAASTCRTSATRRTRASTRCAKRSRSASGAHIPVQISHIKLGTVGVWRKAAEAIALIEAARAARRRRHRRRVSLQRLELDDHRARARQAVRLPAERREGARRRRRRRERADRPARRASGVRVQARSTRSRAEPRHDAGRAVHPDRQGRRRRRRLHVDGRRGHPRVLPAAVGDGRRATAASATRHPRGAGTFPRVLGRYVREQHWLTLPEAIRKMTSAPAARLRLEGRGRIEPGAIADSCCSTRRRSSIDSTFSDPAVLPAGVEKVFVGGELVWDGGKPAPASRGPARCLMSGHAPVESDAGALPSGAGLGPAAGRRCQFGEVPGMTIDAAGRVFAFTRAEPPVIEFDAAGKVAEDVGREDVRVAARHPRRSQRLPLDHRRPRARRHRPAGVQVHARRPAADDARHERRRRATAPTRSTARPTSRSRPTATSSSPTATSTHASSSSRRTARSSRRGASEATGPASSTCRTRSSSTRAGGCWSAIASNQRIQIFDQEGTFLDQWTQFGSPSGIFIAPDDTLYVVDYNDKMALVRRQREGRVDPLRERTDAGRGRCRRRAGTIYVGETVTGHVGDTVTGHRVLKLVRDR